LKNNVRVLATALTISLLSACGVHGSGIMGVPDLRSGQPRISDAVWLQTQEIKTIRDELPAPSSDVYEADNYVLSDCLKKPDNVPNTLPLYPYVYANTPSEIGACTAQMKILIDRRYEHWIDSLNAWTSSGNAVVDSIVVSAGVAGGAAGGVASQALNGFIAALTGTKKSVEQDIFYIKSVQIIIAQMQTDRAKWDVVIQGRLQATQKSGNQCPSARKQALSSPNENADGTTATTAKNRTSSRQNRAGQRPSTKLISSEVTTENADGTTTTTTTTRKPEATSILPYCTLAEAFGDLETYARQGSFENALLALSNNVSAQASACQAEKLNVRKAETTATAASGQSSKATDATATSPCPTSTPSTPPASPAKGSSHRS
jgi:hypothetical protein